MQKFSLLLFILLFTFNVNAEWTLVNATSNISFVSVKKSAVSEKMFSGKHFQNQLSMKLFLHGLTKELEGFVEIIKLFDRTLRISTSVPVTFSLTFTKN